MLLLFSAWDRFAGLLACLLACLWPSLNPTLSSADHPCVVLSNLFSTPPRCLPALRAAAAVTATSGGREDTSAAVALECVKRLQYNAAAA